jgi:DNA-binding NarL/FixJ family response regulator
VPVRVIIAEDNLIAREGIRQIVDSDPDLLVVAACGTLDEVFEAVERERPDGTWACLRD